MTVHAGRASDPHRRAGALDWLPLPTLLDALQRKLRLHTAGCAVMLLL
jgi:hypothetical protein